MIQNKTTINNFSLLELEKKFKFWEIESNLNKFYNNQNYSHSKGAFLRIVCELNPQIGIEILNDNAIIFKKNSLIYKNLTNGNIDCLRAEWNETDHLNYQELCALISPLRTSTLVDREIINLNNIDYEYTQFVSPSNHLGKTLIDKWLDNNKNHDFIHDYIIDFINDSAVILAESRKIAYSSNYGIPLDIVSILSKFNDIDDKYYWNFGLDWTANPDFVIEYSIECFIKILDSLHTDQRKKDYLKRYMREKWSM